jgi:hypothetical protein
MTHFRPPMHCRRSAPARLGDVRHGPHYSSEVTRCFREVLSTPVQPRIDAAMPAGALPYRAAGDSAPAASRPPWAGAIGCSRERSYGVDAHEAKTTDDVAELLNAGIADRARPHPDQHRHHTRRRLVRHSAVQPTSTKTPLKPRRNDRDEL